MSLSSRAFQNWLNGVAEGATTSEVCRAAGIKRTTLAQQLVRGKVTESTVVAIARAYGLNPLAELACFDGYRDLLTSHQQPTDAELLSQISTEDLLADLAKRLSRANAKPWPDQLEVPALTPIPHSQSVRNWVDAVDTGEIRQQVSATMGVAPQNFSAQLSANRLAPELAVSTARLAGLGPASALVVTELITPQEASWPEHAREKALARIPDSELAQLAADRLQVMSRTLRKQEQDIAQREQIWEHLG
ncbi:hypothetical protein ACQR35_06155 [Pseudarthrobacter sp. J1738]|uniref:hypothetical protein n=1 Tax=unclassified Pseudarthrobacter TaxID=2647000 RepID=UPI003D2C888D